MVTHAVYIDIRPIILCLNNPCASRTLNLIATHDADKTKADNAYKKVYYCTLGKCSALWNKWSRSVHAAEVIKDGLEVSLVVPNDTRWNSQYDALDQLRGIISETSADPAWRGQIKKDMRTAWINSIASQ